jgi:hypothetical protein
MAPRAHLERGYKPVGGANSSPPRLVILNFYFSCYLSRSVEVGYDTFPGTTTRAARSGSLLEGLRH